MLKTFSALLWCLSSFLPSATFSVPSGKALDGIIHPIFVVEPQSVQAGSQVTATVTVDHAPSENTPIYLSSSDSSSLAVASSVTVLAGQTSASFTITVPATAGGSAAITASANGTSVTGNYSFVSLW